MIISTLFVKTQQRQFWKVFFFFFFAVYIINGHCLDSSQPE